MKITITTPSGHIGSKLADILLNSGEAQLSLLARTPNKVEHLAARGARVVGGDQLDAAAVDKAVEGADVLFWAVGMDYTAANVRARYNQFADAAWARCVAIRSCASCTSRASALSCQTGLDPSKASTTWNRS